MKRTLATAALALAVAFGSGCSQKEPAQKSIAAAEQALIQVDEQAQKYIPEKYNKVKAQLDEARQAFKDGKYEQAVKVADAIPASAKQLGEEAAAAQAALAARIKQDWQPISEAIPGKIAALDARIKELEGARRLPAGVDRKAVDAAKAQQATVQKAWTSAQDAYQKGDFEAALLRAKATNLLIVRLMQSLGVAPPDAGAAEPAAKPAG